jgi:cation transport protein ChaC
MTEYLDDPAPGWLTEEERQDILSRFLEGRRPGEPIWVFAYGSLIWKPAFGPAETRLGTVHGHHRRFCLLVRRFRGTDAVPGLVLALDAGGRCRGVVFRLDPATEGEDLDALWRREMVTAAYRPIWVRVETAEGPVRAVTFAANRRHERYVRPGAEESAAMIARATGPVGSCADYLFNTAGHLEALGIRDRPLVRLRRLVEAVRGA